MVDKPYHLLGTLGILAIFFAGCGRAPGSNRSQTTEIPPTAPLLNIGGESDLLILAPPDLIDPEMYPEFQGENELEISEIHYQSDPEAINLVRSFGDQEGYDLLLLSDYAAQVLINENYLAPIDHTNVPNLAGLADRFKNLPYDPDNRYCAPILWSTTGITYDASQTTPPSSWGALFSADVASPLYGRISLLDNAREALGAALLSLGYDINTDKNNQIQEAGQILKNSAASRIGFVSEDLAQRLVTREIGLAQGVSSQLSAALESNQNLSFSLPQEGGILHVWEICIPRTARAAKKVGAEKFIDFLLQPETNAILAGNNFSGSPVEASRNLLSLQSFGENFRYPPDVERVPLQIIRPLGEADQMYTDTFDEVKSSSP